MLQFTSGKAFSLSIGSLLVSGTMESPEDGAEKPALPLHIASNGIDFFLDDRSALLAYTGPQTSVRLEPVSFDSGASYFTVRFTGGVSVSFQPEKRGDTEILSITADMPEKYQKIAFPYKITRSARVEKKDNMTLVSAGKKYFALAGSAVPLASSSGAQQLVLGRTSPVGTYQTWIPAKGIVIENLASLPGASETAWKRASEQFAANALASFRQSVAGGSASEPAIAAYVAEMGRIGMYHAAVDAVPDTFKASLSRTWLTNTFFNNLEKTWGGFIVRERDERTLLSRKIAEGDRSFLEFPSLVPFLVDRGSSILLKDLERIVSAMDMGSVTAFQSSGLLEALMDAEKLAPASATTLALLADSCERKLSSSFVRIGDNLYVSEDGLSVDTLASFRIASTLIRYGSRQGKAGWKSAGYLIATSLVSFAGDRADWPARFQFADSGAGTAKTGIIAKTDQVLSASVLYPVVMGANTWYPRARSLALEAGPGIWAWTSAQDIIVSKPETGSMKLSVKFPQGETHYMVVRGIKPFSRIQIYGMDFRTDPRFESYNSSGYRYDQETETLFLKMRHKAEYEDIVIWFGEPPAQLPVPLAPVTDAASPTGAAGPTSPGQNSPIGRTSSPVNAPAP